MATKVFHPAVKVAHAAPKIDLAACVALARRSRATDVLFLCFGIGIGVLLYAIVHDIVLRLRPADDILPTTAHCHCCARWRSFSSPHTLSHSHHLSSSTPRTRTSSRFLTVPAFNRPAIVLDDEKA